MSSIWQGSFNYQFEIFGLTQKVIEPVPHGHGATNPLLLGQVTGVDPEFDKSIETQYFYWLHLYSMLKVVPTFQIKLM